jgi:hypothetical protein
LWAADAQTDDFITAYATHYSSRRAPVARPVPDAMLPSAPSAYLAGNLDPGTGRA